MIHWQHKLREFLELPLFPFAIRFHGIVHLFSEKESTFWIRFLAVFFGIFYVFIFPLLLAVSGLWFLFAFLKRFSAEIKGLKLKTTEIIFQTSRLPYEQKSVEVLRVSCGNFVVGGSGKSPLVRYLLMQNLRQNIFCVLLSRGVGDFNSEGLSDENKEHFEFLKQNFSEETMKKLKVLQGKNRGALFESQKLNLALEASSLGCSKMLVIADDALQHLSWKRNVDICLWPEENLKLLPWICMPLGIFREGLFLWHKFFLRRAEFHVVWNTESAIALVEWGETPNRLRVFEKKTEWFEPHLNGELQKIGLNDLKSLLQTFNASEIGIVLGIAKPERVLSEIDRACDAFGCEKPKMRLILPDHGSLVSSLEDSQMEAMKKCKVLLTTSKDFYRWQKFLCEGSWKLCVVSPIIRELKDVLNFRTVKQSFESEELEFGTWQSLQE